ncbi:MAG: undecaprenyl-diphosphate phosphatase [Clostridia bacterium]|nr:undecaprenyl-diphosphate phosphatase [Clostridia bacterium]
MIEYIKSFFLGIVEGITEWLPVSSTGHLILFNEFLNNEGSFLASDLYIYVIQLGAILAVVTHFFHKLNPFSPKKNPDEKKDTWNMWFKVIVACIPAAVAGLLLNDFMENFENWQVVSATLIIYGIAFIIIEKLNKKTNITKMSEMTYKTAVLIGMFQVLSIIPGTSRSGSTILGGMILGTSRSVAAEFSFFLAIPVMFGVSLLKIVTYDGVINWGLLAVGMIVSYIVSMLAIKFLMNYVQKHNFSAFGWYRIILALIVIFYFSFIG